MRYGLCGISIGQIWNVDAGTKALPLLKAAYDRGINTVSLSHSIQLCYAAANTAQWDTANVYSNGSSEEIIGRAIRKYNIPRHKLVICTKCCGTVRESNDPEVLALQDIDNTVDYVNQRGTLPWFSPTTPQRFLLLLLSTKPHQVFPAKASSLPSTPPSPVSKLHTSTSSKSTASTKQSQSKKR